MLYGTTYAGGKYDDGTVFSISKAGRNYATLYSFGVTSADGWNPTAALIDANGTLYGTTSGGGKDGAGTVFSITPSGEETVLHSFGNDPDGANPLAPLVDVNGTLYGTTAKGGAYSTGSNWAGTLYSLRIPSNEEEVLHSFNYSGGDGAYPVAAVTAMGGSLYGATPLGGTNLSSCVTSAGTTVGTVFDWQL